MMIIMMFEILQYYYYYHRQLPAQVELEGPLPVAPSTTTTSKAGPVRALLVLLVLYIVLHGI